jgi:2-oxoglutarate dehydrogenase E2 component (dihydrolipoamide succinyltransferase)
LAPFETLREDIIMTVEVTVPQIGESISEVQIVQWLKREGEAVAKDEALVSIDSEKATLEIPAPAAGVVGKIVKGDGELANVGDVIGTLEEAPAARKPAAASAASSATGSLPTAVSAGAARPASGSTREETPRAVVQADKPREVAGGLPSRSAGVAAGANTGTAGQAGGGTSVAAAGAVAARQEEVVPMSIIRRHIAQRLVEAQQQAALLTTFNEVDMSAVLELRKKYRDVFQQMYNIKLGFMSFFAKAAVEALKQFPAINAEIRGKSIVYRNYYDIGVAIGGGKGLVVPVLRDVQRMSFAEIERAIDAFAKKAAQNQLLPEDLEGGTFTISNGGIYGSLLSTPIVNPPQSGILGLHAIQERPVARDGQVVIRPMMYLALTYDHRLVDGREAVTFLRTIQEILQDPARMLLEV